VVEKFITEDENRSMLTLTGHFNFLSVRSGDRWRLSKGKDGLLQYLNHAITRKHDDSLMYNLGIPTNSHFWPLWSLLKSKMIISEALTKEKLGR